MCAEKLYNEPAVPYGEAVKAYTTLGYEGLLLPAYAPGVEYERDGKRQVADGKHTFAVGVTGKKARPVTVEDTAKWAAREAMRRTRFNTLLKCGPIPGRPGYELAFLDVDGAQGHAKDVDGAASLAAFAAEHGLTPLPLDKLVRNTNRSLSLREGHYGVIVPSGRVWTTPAGVDFIGVGIRSIVAPGGLHKSGRRYRAACGDEPCRWPRIDAWPELPAEWVEALSRPEGEARAKTAGEWKPTSGDGRRCKIVQLTVDRWSADPTLGRGCRHDGMMAVMSHLAHLASEGHRGADDAAREIAQAFGTVTGDASRVEEAERAARDAWADHGGVGGVDPCDTWLEERRAEREAERTRRVFEALGVGDPVKPVEQEPAHFEWAAPAEPNPVEPKPFDPATVSRVEREAAAKRMTCAEAIAVGDAALMADWGDAHPAEPGAGYTRGAVEAERAEAFFAWVGDYSDGLSAEGQARFDARHAALAAAYGARGERVMTALWLMLDTGVGLDRLPRGWREWLLRDGAMPPERAVAAWRECPDGMWRIA